MEGDNLPNFPPPSTVKELQAFLSMVNFYRRFLPGVARTLRPLTDELRSGRKGPDRLDWSDPMRIAFAGAKQALLSAMHLAHPTTGPDLSLVVDAWATHVGSCLQQQLAGRKDWQPLGFFSKKLEPTQEKYSAFDRELFACFAGIRHFRHMLDGRRFAVYTDHKPLTYPLSRVSDPWTVRQCRQLSYVAEYTSDIRHIASAAKVVADTLSRPPGHAAPALVAALRATAVQGGKHNSIPASVAASVVNVQSAAGFSYTSMAAHQTTCPSTLQASKSSSLTVQAVQVEGASLL